jgi:hypothetical protein
MISLPSVVLGLIVLPNFISAGPLLVTKGVKLLPRVALCLSLAINLLMLDGPAALDVKQLQEI